ncbi:hypothetical protein IWQ57_004465 [Coemansia nantahalensis]|uniref:Uncharacterized protein n=1 Tax=Coemansia nantahalensis TaxID=2789366 RepID=A0ACC1JSG4_9FUNG|nr:hypothetical protein IWQ57_004465 [Coemansia nantahalensis]
MDDGADLYALLGVAAEAGEKELARAYRAKALQLHPDKNRDSPDAARLFHGVKDAYELLTDPQRRAAYDAQRRAQAAKRQRHTALSGERKRMKAQLERDERAARDAAQARAQSTHAEAARFRDEAQRAEARRDRELREHVRQAAAADAEPGAADSVFDDVEELDRSVVVRWASDCHHDRASLAAAFAAFGGVEEVVVAPVSAHARRRGETKPPSALVVFRSLAAAHALVSARPDDPRVRGFTCSWAGGAEPAASQAKAVEARYPVVARTFAVAKSTANSALDRVDYLVDYVLPPSAVDSSNDDNNNEGAVETPAEAAAEGESAAAVDSPLEKVTVLVHKVPKRLGRHYYEQLQASKAAIGNLRQSVKDTVNVYESELGERSQRLLGSVQARVWSTVSAIPGCLPQFAQQYIEHGKDVLVSKAAKLHAEYSRTDEDIRTKVFNLILISGEQVPVLEEITARVFGKATAAAAAAAAAADECSDDEKAGSPSN